MWAHAMTLATTRPGPGCGRAEKMPGIKVVEEENVPETVAAKP